MIRLRVCVTVSSYVCAETPYAKGVCICYVLMRCMVGGGICIRAVGGNVCICWECVYVCA